jgi:hypothetical protein
MLIVGVGMGGSSLSEFFILHCLENFWKTETDDTYSSFYEMNGFQIAGGFDYEKPDGTVWPSRLLRMDIS